MLQGASAASAEVLAEGLGALGRRRLDVPDDGALPLKLNADSLTRQSEGDEVLFAANVRNSVPLRAHGL